MREDLIETFKNNKISMVDIFSIYFSSNWKFIVETYLKN